MKNVWEHHQVSSSWSAVCLCALAVAEEEPHQEFYSEEPQQFFFLPRASFNMMLLYILAWFSLLSQGENPHNQNQNSEHFANGWVGFALPETFFWGPGLRLLMDRSQTLKPLPHLPPSKQEERPLELRKRRILQKNSREKRESGNKCKPCMVVEPGCGIQDESGIRNRRRRFLALHRRCRISITVSVCLFSSVHTVLSRETRETLPNVVISERPKCLMSDINAD